MDSYVDLFQSHGGFYLGSIGGPSALRAKENIRKVELLVYPAPGMEAVYRIEVVDFPAFVLVDDKGNDFYASLSSWAPARYEDPMRQGQETGLGMALTKD